MRRTLLTITALLGVLVLPRGSLAGERFILRTNPDLIGQVCADHGLRVVREIARRHLVLVEGPGGVDAATLRASLEADNRIYSAELTRRRPIVDVPQQPSPTDGGAQEVDRTPSDFYGTSAWEGYVEQPAVFRVGADQARAASTAGQGVIVAVIDTGVDASHPVLSSIVGGGYDFVIESTGEPEDYSLSQSAVILQQSPVILQQSAVILQQSAVILQQSPVILQQSAVILQELETTPTLVGHGTMVAGLIRLIAPKAQIMPLRAFSADGTGSSEDVIRAVYYAVDHGAKVINMSFATESREVKRAIQYATNRGVICIAAAGNQAKETIVFPAALNRVLGVAATTLDDARASFSNYGPRLVSVAAPGENLLTTYPGGRYAIVSGTSFSTAIVSAAAAILASAQPEMDYKDAEDAFRYSLFLGPDLGFGRIDIPSALSAVQAQVWSQPRRWMAAPGGDQP